MKYVSWHVHVSCAPFFGHGWEKKCICQEYLWVKCENCSNLVILFIFVRSTSDFQTPLLTLRYRRFKDGRISLQCLVFRLVRSTVGNHRGNETSWRHDETQWLLGGLGNDSSQATIKISNTAMKPQETDSLCVSLHLHPSVLNHFCLPNEVTNRHPFKG